MSVNTYRAKTKAAEAAFSVGEFEHEFASSADEADWVTPGLLEIVPQTYRVLTDTAVHGVKGTDKDPTFEAALPMETEAALITGGHIERVKKPATTKKKED